MHVCVCRDIHKNCYKLPFLENDFIFFFFGVYISNSVLNIKGKVLLTDVKTCTLVLTQVIEIFKTN